MSPADNEIPSVDTETVTLKDQVFGELDFTPVLERASAGEAYERDGRIIYVRHEDGADLYFRGDQMPEDGVKVDPNSRQEISNAVETLFRKL